MSSPTKSHLLGNNHGNMFSYSIGFILSLILTLDAYIFVVKHALSGGALILALSILAVLQLLTQLIFFLHVGSETKPRLNLLALLFAVMVVFTVVGGSIWIMNHLDYHHASPSEVDTYIQNEERIYR
jgi:cytochrome o ubiquinol oxidase subunit IV